MDKNHFLIELSESSRTQFGKVNYDEQTPAQKVFSAIWGLEAEVNNGGFHQNFFNGAGEAASDIVAALKTIDAHQAARIVENAVAAFPYGPPPRDFEPRQELLADATSETVELWNQLDQEFFNYPDNLTDLLYAFVKAHPEEFGPAL
jgi:hypothetical protein